MPNEPKRRIQQFLYKQSKELNLDMPMEPPAPPSSNAMELEQ